MSTSPPVAIPIGALEYKYSHAGAPSRATSFRQLIIASQQLRFPKHSRSCDMPETIGVLSRLGIGIMKTPVVTEVEIIYDRESESPLPKSVVDLTFTKDERRKRKGVEVPVLGDGLDLEDPMVSHYADTAGQLAQDEKAAMDPSKILNGADRLRHKPFVSERCEDEGQNEDDLPSDIGDGDSGISALRLTEGT